MTATDKMTDAAVAARPVIDAREPVDMRTTTPGDFPQFLGPRRNLVVTGVALARDWTTYRPRQLWRQPIGAGWSGFTAVNGFAVTMEQRGPEELVTCYEVTTGRLRWAHAWAARYETMSGGVGPRSTPTIADGLVYAITDTKVFFVFDPQKREVTHREDFSAYGGPAALGMHTGPDGNIYALMTKAVVRVTPGSLEHESLGQPPAGVGAGGALVDGVLYYSAGSHVWAFDVPGL